MKNKVLIVLSVMFTFQFIVSCCNCDSTETFENHYNELAIIPYDTSGFSVKEATEDVYKNAFGLGVMVNFETVKVSDSMRFFCDMSFGTALAFSCDCEGDTFLYPDPLAKLIIYALDPISLERTVITERFKIQSYDDSFVSIDVFFEQRQEWHDGFRLTLVDYNELPNKVIFVAEVFLESGKSFINQTSVISFVVS